MDYKIIVVSDLHLTDNPDDEYRWKIFPQLEMAVAENDVDFIFMLGDGWDRKDRHSANLINRAIQALVQLRDVTGCPIYILQGNHDAPLNGIPYWSFLDNLTDIHYITAPLHIESMNIWLLPFAANPVEAWSGLTLSFSNALFMHQTVAGAVVENGYVIPEKDTVVLPELPDIPIYSGDVHNPQVVKGITYVGTPYPTRFGETWPGSAILLNSKNFSIGNVIELPNLKKRVLKISSVAELDKWYGQEGLSPGDQIRVVFSLALDKIITWSEVERRITAWAGQKQLKLYSIEAEFIQDLPRAQDTSVAALEQATPQTVLETFAEEEKLPEPIKAMGLKLIGETT